MHHIKLTSYLFSSNVHCRSTLSGQLSHEFLVKHLMHAPVCVCFFSVNIRTYDFWTVVKQSGVVTQQLCRFAFWHLIRLNVYNVWWQRDT